MNKLNENTVGFLIGFFIIIFSVTVIPYYGQKLIDSDFHLGYAGNYEDGTDEYFLIIVTIIPATIGLFFILTSFGIGVIEENDPKYIQPKNIQSKNIKIANNGCETNGWNKLFSFFIEQ